MNYIITKNRKFFENIGDYNYCGLDELSRLPDTIAFDTETTSLYPRLGYVFSIQIGTGKDNYIIDLQHLGDSFYIFKDVIPYLEGKCLVGHNLTFDLGWCYKYDFFPKRTKDTFIASKLLYNGKGTWIRHDFGTVMERELNLHYDKSEQKNIAKTQLSNAKAIQYAFNDVDRLLDLERVMDQKLREVGTIDSYIMHCDYIQALAYMEQCGLPINSDAWYNKMQNDLAEGEKRRREVIDYIYDNIPQYRDNQLDLFYAGDKTININIDSPKQMIGVFDALGINHTDADGKDTIDATVIKKSDHEFIDIWLAYQSINHDISTYGENYLRALVNDTLYTSFNPILDTARISTRKEGFNILNLPANKKTRECIKPHKGFQLIVSDYEGQENVCGADMHQDKVMVSSLLEGKDLHCAFARLIFPEIEDLDDEEIMNSHKSKRNYSKSPRFLFAYGGNAYSLYTNNNIPLEESTRLEKLYKQLHAGVYKWGDEVFEEACEKGYIESADGFKLYLPYYDEFYPLYKWYKTLTKEFWWDYSEGKKLFNSTGVNLNKEQIRKYDLYRNSKEKVSQFFKMKSKYYKLCLNNPIQTTAAHQTKRAAVILWNYIRDNNHIWRAKISNIPHDEFVLEVEEELVEEYKKVLEKCMIEGGNYYLKNNIVKMKAEANSGYSWYEAK